MKITTTKTESVEMEIPVPYFCQLGDYFIKVVNEKQALTVSTGGYQSISMCDLWIKGADIAKATVCSEDEFNEAFLSVINNITDSQLKKAA